MRITHLATVLFVSIAACTSTAPQSNAGSGSGGGGGGSGGGGGGSGGGGGGSGSGGGGSGSAMQITSATQFLAVMDDGDCDEAWTCMASFVPDGSDDTFAGDFGTSNQDCYTEDADYEDPAQVEADITAGIISFNAADATACIAGIVYPTNCATYWADGEDYPDACDTALVGTVGGGGACKVDWDCSGDNYCLDNGTCGMDSGDDLVVHRGAQIAHLLIAAHR